MTQTVSLYDIIDLMGGGTPKTSVEEYWGGDIGWLSVVDFSGGCRWVNSAQKTITKLGLEKSSTKLLSVGDIIISARGTVGELAQLQVPMAFNQSCYGVRGKNGVDQAYLYYLLKNAVDSLKRQAHGGVFNTITRGTFKHIKVTLPNLETQKKIADILGSLDEKIELNRRMNETLEQIGQALFRHYFIDNPEREKWSMRELGEFFPVRTGKRDANFSSEDGKYPFFTCSQVVSKAPDFSFDCSAIILAGNGDFNIKYYKGKFEAYQRTYVLSPNKEEFLGFLYFLMKRDLKKITGGSRGSVIKFITKGMIENYKIRLPDDNNILILCIEFNSILDKISQNNIEIATLIKIRDSLLPKLISGEIEV